MRADNLAPFLSVLLDKHHVPPRGCAEVAGVVVGISRPNEAVIGHLVPFFARDFASFAADAHSRIGEETNLNVIVHVRVPALIRAVCAFADHRAARSLRDATHFDHLFLPSRDRRRLCRPGGGSSGCKIAGPACGAYLLSNSANAGPRGRRPGTMLQVSALASMIVTFGSPEIGKKIIRRAAMHQAGCPEVIRHRDLVHGLSVELQRPNPATNECARFDRCRAN